MKHAPIPSLGEVDPTASAGPVPSSRADFILATLPWGVVLLNATSTVLYLNAQAAAWWGVTPLDAQGHTLAQVGRGTLPEPLYAALHRAATENQLSGEYYLPAADQWLAMASQPHSEGVVVHWQNITVQKQREHQYQTLADNTPDALSRWDVHLRLVYANPAFAAPFGQPLGALLGKANGEMGQPDAIAELWTAKLQQVFATGQPQELFSTWPGPAGEERYHTRFVVEMRDGQIDTVLAIARNTTALWKSRQELKTSRDLLHAIAETQTASLRAFEALRDEQGRIVDLKFLFANAVASELAGGQPLVGQRYLSLYPERAKEELWEVYCQVIETGQPAKREVAYGSGPTARWFQIIATRLGDGLLVSSEDITIRKLAEQERTRTLRLLEQSEEVANMGSWDYELATKRVTWSAGMYRLFGLEPGDPPAPPHYLDFVVNEDRPIAERLGRSLLAGASTFEEVLRLRVGDDVKTVRVKAMLLAGSPGQPGRILGVDLDISDVQRLEAENKALKLNQQQELLLAILHAQEAERNRLAESLHNGLGQLLYGIKLQLGQLDVPALHAMPALNNVRSYANQLLAEAIGQTRTLSHELLPTTLTEQGLGPALRDICLNLTTPQLRFTCHVWLDEQVLLPALQTTVYRLAQELAHNIAKHAEATQATIEFEVLPGWVSLRAEDNGRGFDPVATTKGLGLRLLHDAVDLMGGNMILDSSPDYGTHIRLRIPLISEKAS